MNGRKGRRFMMFGVFAVLMLGAAFAEVPTRQGSGVALMPLFLILLSISVYRIVRVRRRSIYKGKGLS
ncbi:hypothetical protein [Paenibacillus sp. FSL H8-0537]|uniref:hypothetical protein n=1 Tax=Paenibacillus sp. FSL H8-0537 TaxID=2921399 RepID=UPI0031015996